MRTTARFAAVLVVGSALLVGCTNGNTNTVSNTNAVVLDLLNEPVANSNSQVNAPIPSGNTNSAALNRNVQSANTNTVQQTERKVSITSSNFSPASITIPKGTSVTWTNLSGAPAKIASDPHPTHTDLPGLVSAVLAESETYSFTFTQSGRWGYHNHEDPTVKGTIIVE